MIYTIEKANLITDQLKKFTTGNTYHIVGHFANIDFWMNEVIQSLKAIDEHRKRVDIMYNTQKEWVNNHNIAIHEYCAICNGVCEFDDGNQRFIPLKRYKGEKKQTRRDLVDITYFFLIRCHRIGLLSDEELKRRCDMIGTGIDIDDLK